jgi:phosphatidylglycerol---prolipoprotein diacylglyceryl transferase
MMGFLASLAFIKWDIDPDLFLIPIVNHPVRWYGLCWAAGLLLSQQIMTFIYKKEGRPDQEVETMSLYIIAGTIIGARLGHILFYEPMNYLHNPLKIFAIWEGGLASHGGTIGILIAAYLFARKTNVQYLWILDRLTIVAALTSCFIRVGNLMNSEMSGLPTNLPWGFIFTSIDDTPRHPTQLYEAIYYFIIFLLSFTIWKQFKDRIKNGFLLGWFLIVLFSLRFVNEFFKINQVEFENNLILNMGQILSIPFVLAGIAILILITRKERENSNDDSIVEEVGQIKTE